MHLRTGLVVVVRQELPHQYDVAWGSEEFPANLQQRTSTKHILYHTVGHFDIDKRLDHAMGPTPGL
jgi:hypothetical protein